MTGSVNAPFFFPFFFLPSLADAIFIFCASTTHLCNAYFTPL